MNKFNVDTCLFVAFLFLLQGCSFSSRIPDSLETQLQAAMQEPKGNVGNEQKKENSDVKLDYEIKRIPLPEQEMSISLEIKPDKDTKMAIYSVKSPQAVKVLKPRKTINLGKLAAGKIYREIIQLKPMQEGMFEVQVFIASVSETSSTEIKSIRIPISVGPLQKSTNLPVVVN